MYYILILIFVNFFSNKNVLNNVQSIQNIGRILFIQNKNYN